jgi:hypothetical protein
MFLLTECKESKCFRYKLNTSSSTPSGRTESREVRHQGRQRSARLVASAKRSRSTACSGRSGRGQRHAPGPEAAACSGPSGRGRGRGRSDRAALRAKRSRRRRAPGVKRSRACSIGGGVLQALVASKT